MSTWTNEQHKAARDEAEGFIGHGGHRIRNITLSDALDEIERLRNQPVQITDDMVEVALNAWFYDELDGIYEGYPDDTTARMRAALEAVLNPPT